MTKRQKKKLENRAGFFHYCDYKLRVKMLYNIFEPVVNNDGPYAFKAYMFDYAKTVLFTKAPKVYIKDNESIKHINSAVFDLRKNNRGEDGLLR